MSRRPAAEPENGPDSLSSADEPSPKKSKRGVQKRVVSVPIGGGSDVEGSKSRGGESYPPSDSWAWRKYGQKPIKGSPYPRGYYRCSSSKGCPARKQVERSRVDPTTLVVTYACEHNHPIPAKTSHHAAAKPAAEPEPEAQSGPPPRLDEASAAAPDVYEIGGGEWGFDRPAVCAWLGDDDVASTTVVMESPALYAGEFEDAVDDAAAEVSGEDESLFGDLGELPECSVVFRRRIAVPCCGGAGLERWTALG